MSVAMPAPVYWDPPSLKVRELMRQGAQLVLATPAELLDELDRTILASPALQSVVDDPLLVAAICRSNRANLMHWAVANIHNPGEPVLFNVGPEPLGIARDLVRRGLGYSSLSAYRVGQNIALQKWIAIAFALTSEPDTLRELLEISTRSISSFIDTMIDGISARMEAEREALTRGTQAERLAVITLILEGAPITPLRASQRLGYRIEQMHRAAIVWSDDPAIEYAQLEQAAEALAAAVAGGRPLIVTASAASLWVWLPSSAEPDLAQLHARLAEWPALRMALGPAAQGMDGFRRSHLDALASQRMLTQLGTRQRLISYDHVWLVSLVTQDLERARQFVNYTLGNLATAATELQRALWTYLEEGCCINSTAARLHAHRNTVLRRVARAEELLPRPLAQHRIQVAVALEVLRWRGDGDNA